MTYTEEYREHIEYTFHAYCKIVIRHAAIDAGRQRCKRREKEISLEYLIDEKHYPLSTDDEYFSSPEPDTEYPVTICGQTVTFCNASLVAAMFRLPEKKREMIYLYFFKEYTGRNRQALRTSQNHGRLSYPAYPAAATTGNGGNCL